MSVPSLISLNPMDFLIDTGSAITMISAFDAKNVGIEIKKLKISDKPLKGIGGNVQAWELGECQLVFGTQSGLLP